MTDHLSVMIEAIGHDAAMTVKTALRLAGYSIYKEADRLGDPLTQEQARRTHPSKLDMQWHNFYDRGPPDWERYTYIGPQNYGNPFNADMACLLWVRLKRDDAGSVLDENDTLRALLTRYRNETPLGHQPHMIAHEVDAALGLKR